MSTPAILSALRSFGGNLISYKDAGLPQKLQNQNWKELGPRLGFAYRALEGKKAFVVRGGYRMSYYPQKLQDWVGAQSGSVPVAANFQNTVSNTALSPDGLPNYGLRSVPQYIAGVNTPDSIININDTRLLARGFNVGVLAPDHTEGRVQDWNLTFEKEIMDEYRPERRLCRQLRRQAAAGNPLQRRHSGLHLVCHQEDAAADRPIRQRGDAALRSAGLREHHAVCADRLWPLQRRGSGVGAALQPRALVSDFLERREHISGQPRHRRYPESRSDAQHQHVPARRRSHGLRRNGTAS